MGSINLTTKKTWKSWKQKESYRTGLVRFYMYKERVDNMSQLQYLNMFICKLNG